MARLFLIPTTLNPSIDNASLLPYQAHLLTDLKFFIVETAKVARAHLKHLNLSTSLQELNIQELNKHHKDYSALIEPLINGHDVGLLSDCGCPAIADPGSRVVAIAHELGHEVIPLVGPNSMMLALMASGFNGQKFSFLGYLPTTNTSEFSKTIKQLEKDILSNKCSQIFIEAPFRNQKLLDMLVSHLNAEIKLCLGINLMGETQQVISKPIKEWKKNKIDITKQEVIFVLGV